MANSTQGTFTLWHSFPVEIQSLIMEHCSTNDLVCLRLTCKTLYSLSPIRQRVPLCNSDPNFQRKTVCLYSNSTITANSWLHQSNHKRAYACRQRKFEEGKYSTLAYRLRKWVPRNLKYCGVCEFFTKRKAIHKGRCFHGGGKERKCPPMFWTHRSRNGAFGRKLWKKWVTNADMNKYERRLRSGQMERASNTRYALRSLPARDVDTSSARGYEDYLDE
ncbi:hypothetical protein HYFRA_00001121 [Hymenoscyphus fraxineus]|uniref:F-box domain-containing protein n=1 Tax=Hymenoscyphus fraxineus TaxID=746836 RepID=A0A9N9KQR3_9HELO|nr:hypothetical protein HYFRA_00001121 [Hymenoscyphus fraxineus]